MNKRRNGKVARLPKNIRDIVNQMLDDGATYATIVQKLAELGYPGFNMMNIHTWRIGGFREWHDVGSRDPVSRGGPRAPSRRSAA